MPELPEVETLAREFQIRLAGRTVSKVFIFQKSRIFKTPAVTLEKEIPGRKIEKVTRAGKFIFLDFTGDYRLAFHLGMTGRLLWARAFEKDPHLHLSLELEGVPEKLFFYDIRRFGAVYGWSSQEPAPEGIRRLGLDPFQITAEEFSRIFKSRNGKIKSLLLNQRLVAGLGNIYADESLFRSGLHPQKRPSRLPGLKLQALHQAIRQVLEEAVESGGSSIDDYVHSDGTRGRFQEFHRVYGKAGSPCRVCGTVIRRVVIAGRSSFFCSKCQSDL